MDTRLYLPILSLSAAFLAGSASLDAKSDETPVLAQYYTHSTATPVGTDADTTPTCVTQSTKPNSSKTS